MTLLFVNMKNYLIFIPSTILLISLVNAETINIEFPQPNGFEAGAPIIFKVTLYDDNGNPLNGQISVTIEDFQKKVIIEKTVSSGEIVTIDLGDKASSGQGMITAKAQNTETFDLFEIGVQEKVIFEIENNILKVTNIGNTQYSKVIKITIGNTEGIQQPNLDPGKFTTYRLVAPDGNYNVKVTDGTTTLTRGDVSLTGTGQAIGAINEAPSLRAGITGVTSPDEESDVALLSYLKRNQFVYVFIAVVFAAVILIGVERYYKGKVNKKH